MVDHCPLLVPVPLPVEAASVPAPLPEYVLVDPDVHQFPSGDAGSSSMSVTRPPSPALATIAVG
jgi:hypothetical protein